jgi:outer membrane protein, multidrug efflux system
MAHTTRKSRVIAAAWVFVMLLLALAASGCRLRPEPPVSEVHAQVLSNLEVPTAWEAGRAEAGEVEKGWLERFNDAQLQALVAEALTYNSDVLVASARVEQAAAYVKVAGGELYPAVNAIARGGDDSSSGTSGLEGVLVSASWEIDVWGRVRYGVRGARDQYAATQADYQFARQSLAALVAKSWFLATEATLQRSLAQEMVASAGRLQNLAQQRLRVGIGSEYDVALARVNVETYRDSLLQIELSLQTSLRALEILLGRYPAAGITAASQLPALGQPVPSGLPSELLERRPDVLAAERRIGAAFNRTQQARAARLPRISLSGSGSDLSSDLFELRDRDNPVWRVSGEVFAPLFSGGALRAQVEVRTAEQRQAMAAYASTALSAFNDVENALSSELSMQSRELVLQAAVTSAEQALQFAETRYRVGAGDLRSVQQEQLADHSARMNLLRVQSERRIQRVNLHLALGGDFFTST